MGVSVDGVKSAPIDILFARGVPMEGPAMQLAQEFLVLQYQEEKMGQQSAAAYNNVNYDDNAKKIGTAGLVFATVAFLVAMYAAINKNKRQAAASGDNVV